MAAETILLEVVTPTGIKFSDHVSEVTAPSVSGEFGVLPGHLPLLAALRTGIVTYKKDGQEHRIVVHHGFAEVANDVALLLTERVATREEVDVLRVRLRIKEVNEELDHWQGDLADPKRRLLIEEEEWLAAQLEMIGDPRPPTTREDTRFLETQRAPAQETVASEGVGDASESDAGAEPPAS